MRSSRSLISPGARSAEITICLFWSTSALKVWKNSSCVLSLPAMNCTSSTISTSTERKISLKSMICLSRRAWTKRYMNCSGQIQHAQMRLASLQFMGNRVHQVGFAKADSAIQKQRVEGDRPALGHAARGGMGQFVRLAYNKTVKGKAGIKAGTGQFIILHGTGACGGFGAGSRFRRFGDGGTGWHQKFDPPDGLALCVQKRQDVVCKIARNPIAKKGGRHLETHDDFRKIGQAQRFNPSRIVVLTNPLDQRIFHPATGFHRHSSFRPQASCDPGSPGSAMLSFCIHCGLHSIGATTKTHLNDRIGCGRSKA